MTSGRDQRRSSSRGTSANQSGKGAHPNRSRFIGRQRMGFLFLPSQRQHEVFHFMSNHRLWGTARVALFLLPLGASAADPLENLPFNIAGGAANLDLRSRYES